MHPVPSKTAPGPHAELRLLAELAPLDIVDPEVQRRLRRHVREGCVLCERALAQAWSALDVLALATPPLRPSPGGWARLCARVERAARGAAFGRSLQSGRRPAAPTQRAGRFPDRSVR